MKIKNQAELNHQQSRDINRLAESLACLFQISPQQKDLVLSLGSGKASNNLEAVREWVSDTLGIIGETADFPESELATQFGMKLQNIQEMQREVAYQ